MTIKKIVQITIPLVLTAGCVESHRQPYAYTTTPTAITVAPTSDYPTERVYSVPTDTVITPPPVVTYSTPTETVIPRSSVAPPGSPIIVVERPSSVPITTTTSSADVALANQIRQMIADDGDLLAAARNARISVYNGTVTMTGTTVTREERNRLHNAIEGVPGVYRLDDRLRATLERSN